MSKEENKSKNELSRREFLKDAGLVVGGAAIGSLAFLNACSNTKTVVETKTAAPLTVTNTATETATATATTTKTAVSTATATTTSTATVTAPPTSVTMDPYTIQLGYYNCDHMTAGAIGKDLGLYKTLGMNVNVTGSGNVPTAFTAGQMDVGYVGVGTIEQAVVAGAPIISVADNFLGGSYYLVVSNSIDITKPWMLLGKKIAIGDKPEINNSSWVDMATRLNIPKEGANYQTVTITGDSNKYLALAAGQIDAYTCCDPWGSMAVYNKVGQIMATFLDVLETGKADCCVLSMRKSFPTDHPDLAKRMVLAHTQALSAMYTHPVKSAVSFSKNYGVPLEVAMMTIYNKTVKEGRMMTWKSDDLVTRLDNTFAYYKKIGMVAYQTLSPAKNWVDLSLLNACGADDFTTFIKTQVDPVYPLGMACAFEGGVAGLFPSLP